jgi:type II secretory pathway pseudopilin PulG
MSQRNTKGFTLIELMLAMSFVSVLLISIAMLTIQISHLYTRGITMKEINQAGTEITSDIKRTFTQAYVQGVSYREDNGRKFLCTGDFTYVANNPDDLEKETLPSPPGTLIKVTGSTTYVRLAKVKDLGGSLCKVSPLPTTLPAGSIELLGGGDRSLVVADMSLSPTATSIAANPSLKADFDAGRMLYSITLTLRSGVKAELTTDSQCLPPSEIESNSDYCAIDTFTIVARVGNTYKN